MLLLSYSNYTLVIDVTKPYLTKYIHIWLRIVSCLGGR